MSKLQVLNTDGCGVCQYVIWSPEAIKERMKAKGFKRILAAIQSVLKSPEDLKGPYCSKHNKLVPSAYKCLDYKPKKQIKIFGTLQDEEVSFDEGLLRG